MIEKLLEYQKVDAELKEIENEIAKSDERRKTHAAQAFLKGVNENLSSLDKRAEELASQFAGASRVYEKLADEIKGYEGLEVGDDLEQLNYIKKKAQALASEITSLSVEIDKVSKEITAVLKEYSKLRSDTKTARAQYDEYSPKYAALKESKKDAMDGIKAKLKKFEKDIPAEVMATYKERRKDKIFPVLNEATVIGGGVYCKCGKGLPDADFKTLKSGTVIECESCHRLLYLKQK